MIESHAFRRTLISVSDKIGLIASAWAVAEGGVEILSTGGTTPAFSDAGIAVACGPAFLGRRGSWQVLAVNGAAIFGP